MMVHGMERLLRRTMPVIVRPTPDEGVELTSLLTQSIGGEFYK
jgi:hypothetical protein